VVFFDTETGLIRPGVLAPPLVCVQLALDDGEVVIAVEGVDPVHDVCRAILQEEMIVGHNVAYDLLVIGRQYPDLFPDIFRAYRESRVSDTIVREKLIRIARGDMWRLRNAGWSLETLVKRYGGVKDSRDPWRLRYMELLGIPANRWPFEAYLYAIHDVEATRQVYLAQSQDYVSPDEARQVRAAWTMHLISAAGVHTDLGAIVAFEEAERELYERDKWTLVCAGLVDSAGKRNVKVAQQKMKEVMEADGRSVKLTGKGGVSLDEEACNESGSELLQAYQRYGSRKNLLTRIQGLKFGVTELINPRFDSLVETGRTSCTKGSKGGPTHGYQIQNMRREVGERECFIPDPGNIILACDYDTMELRTLAQVCVWVVGWSRLAEAIREGLDPHLALAATILGMDYKTAEQIYHDLSHSMHARVVEVRQVSKVANFGFPGGMVARTFRSYAKGFGIDLTEDEAERLYDGWHEQWREMASYFEYIRSLTAVESVRKDRLVQVRSIEQLASKRIRSNITYTITCNGFFQGLAADAAKDAGFVLVQACELGELQGWRCWNFVHDEYILQGPEHDGDRAAKVVQRIMTDQAQAWLPDVPVSCTPVLMRRWSKKASPVYVDGKLVPWDAS